MRDGARRGEARPGCAERHSEGPGDPGFVEEKRCHELAGHAFNVGSPREVAEVLFEELSLPKSKKTKTGYSTDSSVLEKLAEVHPLPQAILDYRQLQKLVNTYLTKLPQFVAEDGRIHTTFNQAVAATGRLSSTDPNLQNIPIRTDEGRRIRDAFVAEEGNVLLSADYSQVELRVLAHFCGAPKRSWRSRSSDGEDIHRRTASEVFKVPDGRCDVRAARRRPRPSTSACCTA